MKLARTPQPMQSTTVVVVSTLRCHSPPRHLRGEDHQAVQAQQPGGRGTTVLTHLGPPPCRHHASAGYARSQVLFWRRYITVSNLLPHVS